MFQDAENTFAAAMQLNADIILDRFCVVGINYRKADAMQRGQFAVDAEARQAMLQAAKAAEIRSLFVLSTCNRTEVHGYATHPAVLADILCRFTKGTARQLNALGFEARGSDALSHLFRMASGLESQIVGDYEIQGQLKHAVAVSRMAGLIGPVMDRTLNYVFQASKKIRSTTGLSSGTVSVSFAAIEWLRNHIGRQKLKALIIGTGKFGTSVCKNLKTYLPECTLSIANRTESKAAILAHETGAHHLPFDVALHHLDAFDIIVTSTTASEPLIYKKDFSTNKRRYIVDLSVPGNVSSCVAELSETTVANVDEISGILEATVKRRAEAIPHAEAITLQYQQEFYEWLHTYKHSPAIRRVKEDLLALGRTHLSTCEFAEDYLADDGNIALLVQKAVDELAVTLKTDRQKGCRYIETYQHFLNRSAAAAKAI